MAKTNAPSFELPDWVNWLAQDSSGSWWGYSVEPLRNDTGWPAIRREPNSGSVAPIRDTKTVTD